MDNADFRPVVSGGSQTLISGVDGFATLNPKPKRVFWDDELRGGSFTFDPNNPTKDDGVIWFNGYKRDVPATVKNTGANISNKTFDLFKRAYEMDKYNTPFEKAFPEYGATPDDGYSSREDLITGTKYYFSSSTGDDSKDGLTPATAMRTLYKSRIVANNMNTGDGILFKRGDVWSSEDSTNNLDELWYHVSGTIDKPKVITSFGLGVLPKFDSLYEFKSEIDANGGWTDEGNGTWSTVNFYNNNIQMYNIWLNGAQVPSSAYLSDLAGATNSYWYYDSGTDTLYINQDPSTISSIKFSKHTYGFMFASDSKYLNMSYLNVGNFRSTSLNLGSASNSTISNCTIGESARTGLKIGANSHVYNNIVDSKEPKYVKSVTSKTTLPCGAFEGISSSISDGGEDYSIFERNTIKNFRHGALMINATETHITTGNIKAFRNIMYLDPQVADYGSRFQLQRDIKYAMVFDNIILNATRSQIMGYGNTIKNNLFYKTKNSTTKTYNTGDAILPSIAVGNSGLVNNTISGNVFYKCDGAAMGLANSNYGAIDNNVFSKNISYMCGVDKPVYGTNYQNDVQLLLKLNDGSYTYQTVDTVVDDNVFITKTTKKPIGYSTEAGLNSSGAYFTLDEFKSLVDSGIPEVASFERNVNIDLAKLIED